MLDEPTSGLDPLMRREFFAILEERNKAGVTVFLSGHVLAGGAMILVILAADWYWYRKKDSL